MHRTEQKKCEIVFIKERKMFLSEVLVFHPSDARDIQTFSASVSSISIEYGLLYTYSLR